MVASSLAVSGRQLIAHLLSGVKMPVTYAKLKAAYDEAGQVEALAARYGHRAVIRTLAEAENDEQRPLAILEEINAELAGALRVWTAGHSLEMSCIQRHGSLCPELRESLNEFTEEELRTHIANLETHFCELPLFSGCFTRADRDAELASLEESSEYEIPCFKSGSAPGGRSVSEINARFLLHFQPSQSARLVGALSLEYGEREILIRKGTRYRVTRAIDAEKRENTLCEIS